ncbi:MAG TPA: NAD(P)-dependent oxidoreductase [Myxococcales bacterium]
MKGPVGIVGCGLLGSAVSRVLLEAGYAVVGTDLAPAALAGLASRGGEVVASAAEVARRARTVFAMLPTLESVEEAVASVLEGAAAGATIVQMSTISPQLAVRLEEAARARGVAFLDAPVSGTSGMVARREGVITVGGDRGAYDAALPVLEAVAKKVYFVGACGQGSMLKLVTNLIMGLNTAVVAEGLNLARRAGLDPAQAVEILAQGAGASRMLEVRGPLMVEGRFEPYMKVELFLKDIRLMIEAAQALHVPLPLGSAMQQLFTAAYAGGQEKEDLASVLKVYERMSGGA